MANEKIDWQSHIEAYRKSKLTRAAYCQIAQISPAYFTKKVSAFKKPASFPDELPQETAVFKKFKISELEISICIDSSGQISLRNLSADQLPPIIETLCALHSQA